MEELAEDHPDSGVSAGGAEADKLLRLQADFENFRRRNVTARAEAASEARREVLAGLLGIYDNLLRARDHAADAPAEAAPYLQGFDAIRTQLEQFLRAEGLEEIEAEPGIPFDPNVHEAAGMMPAADEEQGGTVAEVVRKGFSYKGSVVRPVMVLVYQAS